MFERVKCGEGDLKTKDVKDMLKNAELECHSLRGSCCVCGAKCRRVAVTKREKHVFDPELLKLFAEPDGWERDGTDVFSEEWWWDPDCPLYVAPDDLKERVMDELDRCNPYQHNAAKKTLQEPGAVLRLVDCFPEDMGYAGPTLL